MSVVVITPKKWDIPRKQLDIFNEQEIEDTLFAFNKSCTGYYYMLDYYHEKIIVASNTTPVLCGYSKKVMERDGFDFFQRILNPKEQKWLDAVNTAAWKIFYRVHEQKRRNLSLSYDLSVKTVNKVVDVLHYRVTPFKLCQNGNLWLGLCHVMLSPSKEMENKAEIVNTETGQRYVFSKSEFMPSKTEILTNREIEILQLMAKDMTGQQISKTLGIALTVYNRHKRSMFDKLGVDKAATAIHKAHIEGII